MDKKSLGVWVLFAILIVAAGYFVVKDRERVLNSKSPSQQKEDAQKKIGPAVEDKKIADNTKPFKIDIVYPFIAGQDGFNKLAGDLVNNELNDFKSNSLANDDAVKKTDPQSYAKYPREYDLEIKYVAGEVDENIISVVFDISNFEGGAHGAHYFKSLSYSVKDKKELKLADLFSGQADYLKKISDYCIADLTKQVKARMGDTGGTWIADGAGPKDENYSVFLVNKDNIVFYFPEYQVAPYVAGDFEVTMPK